MAAMTGTRRDMIVIGSSAGGIRALQRLLRSLPATLPASVFICQHQTPSADPRLAPLLQRAASIGVSWAEQGERIRSPHIYVAPPALDLIFTDGHLGLASPSIENYASPSIDRLFRSAAVFYPMRTIAVLLTGMMDDGVAGAVAVQAAGGRMIVQDPAEAAFPELPQHALAALRPDAVLGIDQIARTLVAMTAEPDVRSSAETSPS